MVIIFILSTGGKTFMLGETQVQLRGIENPLTLLYFLIVIRISLDRRTPFLGIVSLHPGSWVNTCSKLSRSLYLKISTLGSRGVFHIVIIIIGHWRHLGAINAIL